jgi:nitrogen-specific signal transduction histidine kinase
MSAPRKIAHDLNNITFVIYGYAQRLEEVLPKNDPLQEDVQAILNEIPRLTAVVDRIRELDEESSDSAA